ncbi:SPOR domain-containing protein [Marinoscillum sp.]|uniref:SPOR domain-containing protein n=1 Tax=Marinoscillum sp. TaxID=2024838 RepID=UPI003BAA169E
MADDKNKNEDPEEERDDQFDDDEDFGLPDLEYDELDDDDDEDLSDEEQEDALEEEIVPKDDDIDLSGDNLDDVELTAADLEDSDEPEDWEKELEKELEDELKSDDETGGFYEEESYEEFEAQGEEQIAASVFEDDSNDTGFGATSEYTEETYEPSAYTASSGLVSEEDHESNKGKFVRTVVIGTLLFAAIAVVLLYLYSGDGEAPEEKKVAKVEQKAPAKKPEPEVKEVPKEEAPVKVEEKKPVAVTKPKAQKPKPSTTLPAGEITKFDQATGKTYVIVGSFFDDDLATDYANKLAAEGKSPMVIPPFNDSRFYRVAIAGFDTFKDAQQSLDGYKSEYGSDVWTLRY